MSFQLIRAHIESKVFVAFQNLNPPVEVKLDNTLESLLHALCVVHHQLCRQHRTGDLPRRRRSRKP